MDLLEYGDFFYERSLGCVGILKDWIGGTLRKSLISDKDTLTIKDFDQSSLSVSQCLTIADEIINGEKQQEETEENRKLLRNKMGILSNITNENDRNSNKGKRKRVGERNPKRDKVGVDKYAE